MSNYCLHDYYWDGVIVTVQTKYFDDVFVELDFGDAIEPMEAALALYVEIVAMLKGDGAAELDIEFDALDIWVNKLEVEKVFDNCNPIIGDQYNSKFVDLVGWMCSIVALHGGKVPEALNAKIVSTF